MTTFKRSVMMTLYSGKNDLDSHRVRIVLAEKAVSVDINYINDEKVAKELMEINPYNSVPTIVDRDLVLYQPNAIMEYLDERFPHPPLMPVYPVGRAKIRMMIYRIEQDWYRLVDQIRTASQPESEQARQELSNSLVSLTPVFNEMPYFLNEEFSLVDCTIAPILWRLSELGIDLPASAKPIRKYAERIFERPSFVKSVAINVRQRETVVD